VVVVAEARRLDELELPLPQAPSPSPSALALALASSKVRAGVRRGTGAILSGELAAERAIP
jgi:hypothetical protein